jgi:chitinase
MQIDARTRTLLGVGVYEAPSADEQYGSNGGSSTPKKSATETISSWLDVLKEGVGIYKTVKNADGTTSYVNTPAPRQGMSVGKIALIGVGAAAVIGTVVYLATSKKKKGK